MNGEELVSLIDSPTEWPKCPNCGERSLLFGGTLACCIHCNFLDHVIHVVPTTLMRYSRAKMASRRMGHRGILGMLAGKADGEKPRLVSERASQLAQRLIHAPIFDKACRHFAEHGTFRPIALMQERPEEDPIEHILLDEPDAFKRMMFKARKKDVVSIIRIGGEAQNQLFMETHVYNAPSHSRLIHFERKNGKVEFQGPEVWQGLSTVAPVIWQPIYWPIIRSVPGALQPRWVAALEIENDLNITFSVSENMDGAPFVEAAFRKPWGIEAADVRRYPADTAEEGIELLKQKYQTALEATANPGVGKLLFNEEFAWGIEETSHIAIHQLRMAELWKTYQVIREQK